MDGRIIDVLFPNRFVSEEKYNELTEEELKNTFLMNAYYKTTQFKEGYKQATFLLLAEYYKEFTSNQRQNKIPDAILKRNKQYLSSSDELFCWLDDAYESTDNKADVIKLKEVYDDFKASEYFMNLNKVQKRQNNYKGFVAKLESNFFIKKFVKDNGHKCMILTNYKKKIDDDDEPSSLDM
jgi:hypothetical protein